MDDGLVKSIGISNFSCKKIDDLLSYARIQPAAVQVEVHPYFRNQKLVDHCKAKVSTPTLLCTVLTRVLYKTYCLRYSIVPASIWLTTCLHFAPYITWSSPS